MAALAEAQGLVRPYQLGHRARTDDCHLERLRLGCRSIGKAFRTILR